MLEFGKIAALATVSALGLSACQKSPCDFGSVSGQNDGASQYAACLETLDPTPVSQMPTSGSATYTGYMVGELISSTIASDQLVGDARVVANFGTASVTGSVKNIFSSAYNLGGNLSINSGVIAGNKINGVTIDGTLTGYGTESITFATTTTGTHDGAAFAGENAQGIVIRASGSVTFSGSSPGGTTTLGVIAFK